MVAHMMEKMQAGRFVRGLGREHWVVPPPLPLWQKSVPLSLPHPEMDQDCSRVLKCLS